MRSVIGWLVLAAALIQAPGRTLVLDHVRLIDGAGGPPLADARIVMEGDRITAVGTDGARCRRRQGAEHVDLTGRTVLPGLIDAHFHIENRPARPEARAAPARERRHRVPGPWPVGRVLRGSSRDDAAGRPAGTAHPHRRPAHRRPGTDAVSERLRVARDAEEARQFAERNIAQGATAIKIYFRLPLGSAQAVIDVCRARGVVSTAHLEGLEAGVLFEYGLDGVEHITSLGPSLLPQGAREQYRQAVLANNAARTEGRYTVFAGLDLDSADARALWDVIGRKHPFIDPTLAVFERRPRVSEDKAKPEVVATRAAGFQNMLKATRRAFDAGARIVMGGHTTVPFAARGEAPWREIELLVDAGLTPMQAIQAATANGAAFLGRSRDLGTIEPGKLADLVVLTGDPLARISDIRTVERVLSGGAWVDVKKYRDEK